jgi:pyruvyltransferase
VNNFGDLIGPLLVQSMLASRHARFKVIEGQRRLLTVGSVLHFAQNEDVVWGSGVNGKEQQGSHRFNRLDVRAVRGPLTRRYLMRMGVRAPEVYGDPALLLPRFMPEILSWSKCKERELLIAPNLNDFHSREYRKYPARMNPRSPLRACLEKIARSKIVVASSLHAIVIAEALGIPAVPIAARGENPFKYHDYFEGTGRMHVRIHDSLAEALAARESAPPLAWSGEQLLASFPWDLTERGRIQGGE